MDLFCSQAVLRGSLQIPGSKSHTIRAAAIGGLAAGESYIRRPLESEDTRAAVRLFQALGAHLQQETEAWLIEGCGGCPTAPSAEIDVANSGTTMRLGMGACSLLAEGTARLTGDAQIQRRPCGPLAQSLNDLGADISSLGGNGCPPFQVRGRLRGGETTLEAVTSQYLSSLLICAPLGDGDSVIHVAVLNEAPYVEMTLDWLSRQGIQLERDGLREFRIPGGQQYAPIERAIPGDFSSATFFLAAGALPGNETILYGLDMKDTQGDKAVVDYIRQIGAEVDIKGDAIRVRGKDLVGCELDLNATPDALPMMAVLGCFARGTTKLLNVPQARFKETDRLAVMHAELVKCGADVEELEDGLVIRESALHPADLNGHDDHRVVMALAIGASQIPGETTIHGSDAVAITYPGFVAALEGLGGKVRETSDRVR